MIENTSSDLKEECAWKHNLWSFGDARAVVTRWIRLYDAQRPDQPLGYVSPNECRAQQLNEVA